MASFAGGMEVSFQTANHLPGKTHPSQAMAFFPELMRCPPPFRAEELHF